VFEAYLNHHKDQPNGNENFILGSSLKPTGARRL
jgi:hypothetical protein